VIDPAPSVARQVAYVLNQLGFETPSAVGSKPGDNHNGNHTFYTSSDVARFTELIEQLLSPSPAGRPDVQPIAWQANRLEMRSG